LSKPIWSRSSASPSSAKLAPGAAILGVFATNDGGSVTIEADGEIHLHQRPAIVGGRQVGQAGVRAQ
jgi:hypothetical protein